MGVMNFFLLYYPTCTFLSRKYLAFFPSKDSGMQMIIFLLKLGKIILPKNHLFLVESGITGNNEKKPFSFWTKVIKIGCSEQSHYIEVAQGDVSSRAIHN